MLSRKGVDIVFLGDAYTLRGLFEYMLSLFLINLLINLQILVLQVDTRIRMLTKSILNCGLPNDVSTNHHFQWIHNEASFYCIQVKMLRFQNYKHLIVLLLFPCIRLSGVLAAKFIYLLCHGL